MFLYCFLSVCVEARITDPGNTLFLYLSHVYGTCGKRAVSLWKERREAGHYLHHISQLPDDASPALIASEELRVAEYTSPSPGGNVRMM